MTRWRGPCGARRRDHKPCQAPTIPGGFVCRHHGGAAPQVQIAAGLRLRQETELQALIKWNQARSFADLCKVTEAQRAVADNQAKLQHLAKLRRLVAEQRAQAAAQLLEQLSTERAPHHT
jgi:hypothetical protein